MSYPGYTQAERLAVVYSKVQRDENNCLIWLGRHNSGGYAEIKVSGKTNTVHRWMWEVYNGPIPKGLQIDHLCRVRDCVNVNHMELVTPSENAKRGAVPFINRLRGLMVTVCKRGHEYTPENTGRHKTGTKYCKQCAKRYTQGGS